MDLGEEGLLKIVDRRSDEPIAALIGWWLDAMIPTPVRNRRTQVSTVLVQCHNFLLKPFLEPLRIGHSDRTKSEKPPDLLAITLAASPLQVVVEPGRWRYRQLLGEECQYWTRNILMMTREPAAELKEFQQNRDTDISPIGTVGEKALLGLMDRPVFDQLLLVPASFHRAVTFVRTKVTIVPILEHDERVNRY